MKNKKLNVIIGLLVAAMVTAIPSTSRSKPIKHKEKIITLTSDNTLVFNGEVDGENVGAVMQQLQELNDESIMDRISLKKPKDIYMFLYTPGGNIQTGLELFEAIKGSRRKVNTITLFAASMGFQMVQNMGKRYILENGILMSHHARGEFSGEFGGAQPSQMHNRQQLWLDRLTQLDEQTVKRTNGKQTLASYQHEYENELWDTGSKAVKEGYADEVVTVRCDSSLSGVTTHHATILGIIKVTYDIADCPLNTSPMNIHISIKTTKGDQDVDNFLANGGGFGYACLQEAGYNSKKMCALDTTLNLEKIDSLKSQFIDKFTNIKNHIIPMTW